MIILDNIIYTGGNNEATKLPPVNLQDLEPVKKDLKQLSQASQNNMRLDSIAFVLSIIALFLSFKNK